MRASERGSHISASSRERAAIVEPDTSPLAAEATDIAIKPDMMKPLRRNESDEIIDEVLFANVDFQFHVDNERQS
jgi:hypothetical protein